MIKFFTLFSLILFADNAENYYVRETNGGLELITPYGKKVILGDYAPDGGFNYNIQIPLSSIKPTPSPTPTPAAAAPVATPVPLVIHNMYPGGFPTANSEDSSKNKAATDEPKREPASVIPPKITIEYDDTDRMVLEANRLYNKRKYYEATQVVEEIIRKKPEYVRAWIMKGSLMYVQKQNDLAKRAWQQALALEPNNSQVKTFLDKLK